MKYYLPRILCILLVMAIFSVIGAGDALSKFIVQNDADDTARISSFGVTTGVAAGAFSDTYVNEEDNTITVVDSLDSAYVLAQRLNNQQY